MLAKKEIHTTLETLEANHSLSRLDLGMQPASSTSKNANRRRFSDKQIKLLESVFETESKPKSQIKHQLANELGLQPRQISIWFQNRRARSKTKQIKKEYKKLKASYDALASSFATLKRENQSLIIQLQKLKKMHVEQHQSRNCRSGETQSNSDNRVKKMDTESKSKEKLDHDLLVGYSHKEDMLSSSHDSINIVRSGQKTDIFNLQFECTDGSIISSDWHSFVCTGFLK